GGVYNTGPWALTLTYKNSGSYVAAYNAGGQAQTLPGYNTLDASVRYDVNKRLYLQFQAFNLVNNRAITPFSGSQLYSTADTGLYLYKADGPLEGLVSAKFCAGGAL